MHSLKISIFTCCILCFCFSSHLSQAQTPCEELIDEVISLEEEAEENYYQQEFTRSTPAFYLAADLYEEIYLSPLCSDVVLPFSALEKAEQCREMAAESGAFELFKKAKKQYKAGENFGKNQQWKEAAESFHQAAVTWEYGADLTTNEANRKQALRSAKQATDRAKRAKIFLE